MPTSSNVKFYGMGFPTFPSFDKGTRPTLLEANEAKKVKAFIESFVGNKTTGLVTTGSPGQNKFWVAIAPDGVLVDIALQTDLRFDMAPMLSWHLNTNGKVIYAPISEVFLASRFGVAIQNTAGGAGLLKLSSGTPGAAGGYIGHKAVTGADNTEYVWPKDGAAGAVLTTNGGGGLSWNESGGGAAQRASFICVALTGDLPNERYLAAGDGITITDNGANNSIVINATGGGGGMTSWTADADAGTPITVGNGDTVTWTNDYGLEVMTNGDTIEYRVGDMICSEVKLGATGGTQSGDVVVNVGNADPNAFTLIADTGITLTGDDSNSTVTIAAKAAMVEGPEPGEWLEMDCTESPEVRFDDVMVVESRGQKSIMANIDPLFLHVCEPGSIQAIGHTCTKPVAVGIEVIENSVDIELAEPVPMRITVHLSGIRKGFGGKRFQRRSAEEAKANNDFWGGWKEKIASTDP